MYRLTVIPLVGFALLLAARPAQAQAFKATPNDLKQIGIAFHNYCDSFNKGPAKGADLGPFLEMNKRLLDALADGDIVFSYGWSVQQIATTTGLSNTIIAHEKKVPAEGGWVLYGDASVKKVTADEFKKATVAKPR